MVPETTILNKIRKEAFELQKDCSNNNYEVEELNSELK